MTTSSIHDIAACIHNGHSHLVCISAERPDVGAMFHNDLGDKLAKLAKQESSGVLLAYPARGVFEGVGENSYAVLVEADGLGFLHLLRLAGKYKQDSILLAQLDEAGDIVGSIVPACADHEEFSIGKLQYVTGEGDHTLIHGDHVPFSFG